MRSPALHPIACCGQHTLDSMDYLREKGGQEFERGGGGQEFGRGGEVGSGSGGSWQRSGDSVIKTHCMKFSRKIND